jgi:hypothetical protein
MFQASEAKKGEFKVRHSAAVDDQEVAVGAVFSVALTSVGRKSADATSVDAVTECVARVSE